MMTRECLQDSQLLPNGPGLHLNQPQQSKSARTWSVETKYSYADEKSDLAVELARATGEFKIIFQKNVLLKQKFFNCWEEK